MTDSQEAYDAKCPALEAHEADREPTVEERGWEREGRRLDPSDYVGEVEAFYGSYSKGLPSEC